MSQSSDSTRTVRNVTVRELTRETRSLLDDLEANGTTLRILRYGRIVAEMTPTEAIWLRTTGRSAPAPKQEPDEDVLESDLDPLHVRVLELVRDGEHDLAFSALDEDRGKTALALARLEISGLVVKTFGGYRITRGGAAVLDRCSTRHEPQGN